MPADNAGEPSAPVAATTSFSVESLNPGYWEASPLPVSGLAMYYNPGIMKKVLAFRRRVGHVSECPECIGYVALLRAGDLDRRVWIRRPGHLEEGPFWVIDVAGRKDIPHLLARGWVVDVDYETARRWGMRGPIPVTVLAEPSPEALMAAVSLPLHWNADPAPAENFVLPPSTAVEPDAVDGEDAKLATGSASETSLP